MQLNDLQWSPDRTYFITASKDKTAKLVSANDLQVLKTYPADTSLNSACITPRKEFVILGGGQAAMDVTTTAARQGKFEARFYHKIFEDEIGRVRGHFGPLVSFFVGFCFALAGSHLMLTGDTEHCRRRPNRQRLRKRRRGWLRSSAPV